MGLPSFSRPVLAVLPLWAACVTSPPGTAEQRDPPVHLPAWLHAPQGVARDARLEEAAALLCARDTDSVLDTDARHATGLADGQVLGLLRTGPDARATLARDAGPLLTSLGATTAGVVEGTSGSGAPCAAVVAARRLVTLVRAPVARLPRGGAQVLALQVPFPEATLYVQRPDGFVTKLPVAPGSSTVTLPSAASEGGAGEGRYILELLVDDPAHRDPEVALVWPYLVGAPRDAPFPEVLFPDEGHDDAALGHRAEALVQRLRNEQLIEPFKISPLLLQVADERARALASAGQLGHRVAGSVDLRGALRERFPGDARADFTRLAEVQAQASTLADAWQALLDSPAHRYVLVDTGATHAGVAVARGTDAAGRGIVTVVALLGRRAPSRDVGVVRAQLLDVINATRDARGLDPIAPSAHLDRVATRLATRMQETGQVDEALLGAPVGQVALEADASLASVKPLVARLDDPLMLLQGSVPELLLELDMTQLGFGMALDATSGAFFVCLLVGE